MNDMPVKGWPIIWPLNSARMPKSPKALVDSLPWVGSPTIGQLTVQSHVPMRPLSHSCSLVGLGMAMPASAVPPCAGGAFFSCNANEAPHTSTAAETPVIKPLRTFMGFLQEGLGGRNLVPWLSSLRSPSPGAYANPRHPSQVQHPCRPADRLRASIPKLPAIQRRDQGRTVLNEPLLQSQRLTAAQEPDRLRQAPELRLLALGGIDPREVPPALLGRQ